MPALLLAIPSRLPLHSFLSGFFFFFSCASSALFRERARGCTKKETSKQPASVGRYFCFLCFLPSILPRHSAFHSIPLHSLTHSLRMHQPLHYKPMMPRAFLHNTHFQKAGEMSDCSLSRVSITRIVPLFPRGGWRMGKKEQNLFARCVFTSQPSSSFLPELRHFLRPKIPLQFSCERVPSFPYRTFFHIVR